MVSIVAVKLYFKNKIWREYGNLLKFNKVSVWYKTLLSPIAFWMFRLFHSKKLIAKIRKEKAMFSKE